MTHKIAILGASGYTGAELVRLIAEHPNMEITALAAERKAGQTMAEVFPHLRHLDLPRLCKIEQIDFGQIDLCFCALPHKTSQEVIRDLPSGGNAGPAQRRRGFLSTMLAAAFLTQRTDDRYLAILDRPRRHVYRRDRPSAGWLVVYRQTAVRQCTAL